jgi:hypothetical protein
MGDLLAVEVQHLVPLAGLWSACVKRRFRQRVKRSLQDDIPAWPMPPIALLHSEGSIKRIGSAKAALHAALHSPASGARC